MNPQLSNDISVISNAVSAAVTVLGFLIVILQIRSAKRTMQITTFDHLYTRMHEIHTHFSGHPYLRKYFYEGATVDSDSAEYPLVQITAEMLADFFQQINLQLDLMPAKTASGWRAYIQSIIRNSPALRDYFKSNASWYPSNLVTFADNVK